MSEVSPKKNRLGKGLAAATAGAVLLGGAVKLSYEQGKGDGRSEGIEDTVPAAYTYGYIDGVKNEDESVIQRLPNPVIDQLGPEDVVENIESFQEDSESPQQLPDK